MSETGCFKMVSLWLYTSPAWQVWEQLKLVAACKDSYVVYACGFDRVEKWEWFTESMRINENHYKYSDLHWTIEEVRPYFLCDCWWFSVILGDSQISLKLILSDSPISLKLILIDSWIRLKLILSDCWWFLVIHEQVWNHFWGDSWWFILQNDVCIFNKIEEIFKCLLWPQSLTDVHKQGTILKLRISSL